MYVKMHVVKMSHDLCGHVHEFLGSTRLSEPDEERHNHRFAGVTGEAIPVCGHHHVHDLYANTDFFDDHHHVVKGRTGEEIDLPGGKHIHYFASHTTEDEGHRHGFEFSTLIGPSPLTD